MPEPTPLTNYHTHCIYCDGEGEPEQYVGEALRRGFAAFGFSSHAPLTYPVDWIMDEQDLPTYCEHIRSLKEQYRDKIQIYLGLEIDFVPGLAGPRSPQFADLELDYTFGSVHFVKFEPDEQLTVDGPLDEFSAALEREFNGDIERLVSKYYETMRQMVSEQPPDIIGHFDVIKKNNSGGRFFDVDSSWYTTLVMETIEAIADSGSMMEINTGALARGYPDVIYPEPWIVRECFNRNIRMSINSDAHSVSSIDFAFERARDVLIEAGYREQWNLLDDSWQSVPLI